MPKNKFALVRYRVINRCLREMKYCTLEYLKDACERALDISPIHKRTIEGDIHAMRYDDRLGYNAPILMDRYRGAYYYGDEDYSIDNIPLNEDEVDSLVFAAKLLEQFKNVEPFEDLAGTIQKVIDAVNIYSAIDGERNFDFVEFETVAETKGAEFIKPIFDAIKRERVLNIEHRSFTANANKMHIVSPYHLKEYRNRWYVIGYNEGYQEIRSYGLDRIISIETNTMANYRDVGFDAKEHYKHAIGVSVGEQEPVDVLISFTKFQAQYIICQPLHHSQEFIEEQDGKLIFKFHVVPNFEFFSHVMAWCDEVKIIEPESIKEQVKEKAQRIIENYL